jgi:hypothetical protein
MTEKPQPLSQMLAATRRAVIDGPGTTDRSVRLQVALGQPPPDLARLVAKIRDHPYKVTDAEVDALRAHYSEEQLFELIVAAAVGAAEDRLNAALAALEGA